MIVVTSSQVQGMHITKTHGLVRGNTVRASHIGKDIQAVFRNLVGGEVPEYTKMLAEAREQSLDRMMAEARALGANAIVDVRFDIANVMKGTAELLVYGTAVTVRASEGA